MERRGPRRAGRAPGHPGGAALLGGHHPRDRGHRRGLGGADHGPGRRGAVGRAPEDDGDEEEQVVYDLSEWDDESCVALLDALSADTIPYGLDGDELVIGAVDEKRVDEIVAALTTPGATLTVGGPASFEAMSELFVAADELSNDPDDKGATRAIVAGARAAAGASAPFGTDPGWWDGVVARAGALADLVETPNADPEHIVELATAVRSELRPYI